MFHTLKITHKIGFLIGLLSLLAVFLAVQGYYGLKVYETATKEIRLAAERANYGEVINGLVYAVVMDSRGIYMSRDSEEVKKYGPAMIKNLEKLQTMLTDWAKVTKPEHEAEFAALNQAGKEFVAFRTELVRLGQNAGPEAARSYGDNEANRANRKAFNEALQKFSAMNALDIEAEALQVAELHNQTVLLIILSALIGVSLCSLGSVLVLRKYIAKPLEGMDAYLRKLAEGDIDQDVPYQTRNDEVGTMAKSVAILRQGLLRERELMLQAERQKQLDAEYRGQINAMRKSLATIEFNMDGTIITANEHFLNTMGYSLAEIEGKHHSIFATPEYAASSEYRAFWEKLRRGEFDTGEYKRIGKGGREVWIQASYNPILDQNGKPFKVVKFATETTEAKLKNADFEGQIAAINKSQAVIHFNMDGTICKANDIFMDFMGYTADEIMGKHHRMFVDPVEAKSQEYHEFWNSLRVFSSVLRNLEKRYGFRRLITPSLI